MTRFTIRHVLISTTDGVDVDRRIDMCISVTVRVRLLRVKDTDDVSKSTSRDVNVVRYSQPTISHSYVTKTRRYLDRGIITLGEIPPQHTEKVRSSRVSRHAVDNAKISDASETVVRTPHYVSPSRITHLQRTSHITTTSTHTHITHTHTYHDHETSRSHSLDFTLTLVTFKTQNIWI